MGQAVQQILGRGLLARRKLNEMASAGRYRRDLVLAATLSNGSCLVCRRVQPALRRWKPSTYGCGFYCPTGCSPRLEKKPGVCYSSSTSSSSACRPSAVIEPRPLKRN